MLHKGQEIKHEPCSLISQDQLKAYAEASGDPNPIHLDEEVAKKHGLPGVIAHGMLSMAFLTSRAQAIGRDLGAGWKWDTVQTRFKNMTFLGDQISVGGSVRDVTDAEITVDLQCKNQRGEITTTGVVRFKPV